MKPLRFSPSACRDRDAIDDYTTVRFGLEQAVQVREAIARALANLQRMPEVGRQRPELSPPGRHLRSLVVNKAFVIVYEVGDAISVVRILHGARDLPRELLDAGVDE